MKRLWQFFLTGKKGKVSGTVLAIDPRDALSRAMTTPKGIAFAGRHRITPDILAKVPANGSDRFQVEGADYKLAVTVGPLPAIL